MNNTGSLKKTLPIKKLIALKMAHIGQQDVKKGFQDFLSHLSIMSTCDS